MSEIKVKGLAEMQKVLAEMPLKLEKSVVRGALRQAANVVRDAARALVPVRSGKLRKNIEIVEQNPKSGQLGVNVTAGHLKVGKKGGKKPDNKDVAFYASWVEKGTKPHDIKVVQAKGLSIGRGGSGRSWTSTQVHHPGAKAKPFMTPAVDVSHQPAVLAFGKYVKKRLTKAGIDTPDLSIEDPS